MTAIEREKGTRVSRRAFLTGGAAFLAGLHAGVWREIGDIARIRESAAIFRPKMDAETAKGYCERWHKAVERARDWA